MSDRPFQPGRAYATAAIALSIVGIFFGPAAFLGVPVAALSVEKSEGRCGRGALTCSIVCLVLSFIMYSVTWMVVGSMIVKMITTKAP